MNKKIIFAVMTLAVLVSAAFLSGSYAQGARGKEVAEPSMVWRLDLTKEQRENMTAKENAMEKEILPLKNSMRDGRDRLNTELSADKPDNSKVSSLIDSISKDMTDIQKKKVFFMIWMRQQLTADQKQKLLSLIKSRQQTETGSEESGD